jgi:hypothetical protein
MSHSAFALTIAVFGLAVVAAQAAPAGDDRIAIDKRVCFPVETAAALRYDHER